MNIKEVREKFPQYGDLSDEQLADALHQKFYSDMPQAEFRAKIGLSQPDSASFGEKVAATARAGWEGITGPARLAEQVIGKMGIPVVSEAMRADAEERGRAVTQAKQTAPGWATGANVLGSILSPPSVAAMGAFPAAAGAAPSVWRSAAQGAGQGGLFGLMQPVENPDNMLAEKGRQVMFGAAGGGVGGTIGGKAQQVVANRAAQKSARAIQDATAISTRGAGYTIPPTTTNPSLVNRAIEGFAGKLTTAQQASIKNQSVTNSLVRKALGMADDAPITQESLAALRRNAGAAYEAVKGVPQPFVADDVFNATIDRLRSRQDLMARNFPSLANKDITPILDDLAQGQWQPGVAVEVTKRLREQASGTLGNPMATNAAKDVARIQKDAAKALEDLIARNLDDAGMKDLHGAWQAARTKIAKVKNVEKALNESTGNIDAIKLGKQLERGAPLTGELETVARAARAFPKAMRELTRESMPGVSPLDYWSSIGLAGMTSNPLPLALPAVRMGARSLALSPAYQRLMGATSYAPGVAGLLGKAKPALTGAGAAGLLMLGAD